MPDSEVYLGFDFSLRRIGVAVGQRLTCTARPLPTMYITNKAIDWQVFDRLIHTWRPQGMIVGLPMQISGKKQYTTHAASDFGNALAMRYPHIAVHMVDERFTTVEARSELFSQGGYRRIQKSEVDSIAASIILEQWLRTG